MGSQLTERLKSRRKSAERGWRACDSDERTPGTAFHLAEGGANWITVQRFDCLPLMKQEVRRL
jgi:hypothetical protein